MQNRKLNKAINVNVPLQPKQRSLFWLIIYSTAVVIGFGGAAGGAKSHGVRAIAVSLALEHDNIAILIFRKTAPDLKASHVRGFTWDYPELMKFYNQTDMMFKFPNGSIIQLGYAESEAEITKFQSAEFAYIFVDEATLITQRMFEYLRTRNRSSNPDIVAKIIATMNPGGPGHSYFKRIFIDKNYEEWEKSTDYAFLPSLVQDNAMLVARALDRDSISFSEYYAWDNEKRRDYTLKNADYALKLSNLSPDLKSAYLDGNWDAFGGMFFNTFSTSNALIDPFEIPLDWKLYASIDPGFSSPCAHMVYATDYLKNIYVLNTYYQDKTNPRDHARNITELLNSDRIKSMTLGRKPKLTISGLDAWAKKDKYAIEANEATFFDVFQSAGITLSKAVTDRIAGWWAVKSLMPQDYSDRNTPKLYIVGKKEEHKFYNRALLDEIGAVQSDPKDPEDILGKGNNPDVADHALDCLRYGVMAMNPSKESKADPAVEYAKRVYDIYTPKSQFNEPTFMSE